jgi:hypothetical protein
VLPMDLNGLPLPLLAPNNQHVWCVPLKA